MSYGYHFNPISKENFDPTQHKRDVECLIMERDNMFNLDCRHSPDQQERGSSDRGYNRFADSGNFGEITGEKFDFSDVEPRMPLRTISEVAKYRDRYPDEQQFDESGHYNPNLDFDLYQSRPQLEVSYFDPTSYSQTYQPNFSGVDETTKILDTGTRYDSEIECSSLSNSFTVKLYNRFQDIYRQKRSLIISPFNVLHAMIVLYRGSSGRTEEEFKYTLSMPEKDKAFNSFVGIINKLGRCQSVKTAALVLFKNSLPLNTAFTRYVRQVGTVDQFNPNRSQAESQRVNQFISTQTAGKFRNVVRSEHFTKQSSIVVVSTIYFYSRWLEPFKKHHTKKKLFNGVQRRAVNMMHQFNTKHRFFNSEHAKVLEMDYRDPQLCMGFVLPHKFGMKFSPEQVEYFIARLSKTDISRIEIPKFRQESGFKIENLFKNMGLNQAFVDGDFSDITPSNEMIYISEIIHKAMIDVNEEGTEAAAVTADVTVNSAPSKKQLPVEFIADRPFMYYIRFKPTNTILFIGSYI